MSLGLLLMAIPLASGAAQTVGLLCAASSGDGAEEMSEGIMSGCLDEFFDGGLIATDSRPVVVGREEWLDAPLDMGLARDGLLQFLVAIYIEYRPADDLGGRLMPVAILYRILRVDDAALLAEGNVEVPQARADTAKKLEALTRALGASLAKSCLPVIMSSRMGERS